MEVPLQYRARGEKQWREAQTENISRSGVLFRTEGVLDVATEVEMTFVLPGLEATPAIVCRGRVVRTVPPGGVVGWPGIAVTISRFRFQRRRPAA
jgi:PilZ domain